MINESKNITVRGARQHNLKDISLSLPRDALTVITGLSGSGKSTLAFDTLYAEGQRRYVESLSSYARQFLEQMSKPEVDAIEGLPPTVAIEQRSAGSNPRSTVATTTEIYDYLRALFARVGQPHCWKCKKPVAARSLSQIIDAVLERFAGQQVMILAPVVRDRRPPADIFTRLRKEGLVRARLDGEVVRLEDQPDGARRRKSRVDAVIDRLQVRSEARGRLADGLELADALGDGTVVIARRQDQRWRDELFSTKWVCTRHPEIAVSELTPRLFSFNAPYGACPDCGGLGTVQEFDEELIVDGNRSLGQGAVDPWRQGDSKIQRVYQRMIADFCRHFDVALETPVRNLHAAARKILLSGTTRAEEKSYGARFEGVIPNLHRRLKSTESDALRRKLQSYLTEISCSACGGTRLRPEARSVRIAGDGIDQVVSRNVASALQWVEALQFSGESAVIAGPLTSAIATRLRFMLEVGVGYLTLDRSSITLSGGEGQRIRLATQVGTGMVGVCYILDEPTIGLHARDGARLVDTLQRLRDMGNTVIVVEHDQETIAAADHIVDMGPGAGTHGGEVIAQGALPQILKAGRSVTGQYLSGAKAIPVPEMRRTVKPAAGLQVRGARENNLKDIDVSVPLGCFVCVTGVSGSGKSTLVNDILLRALKRRLYASRQKPGDFDRLSGGQEIDKVVEIDQSPIGRSPRSNPATYVGVFDLIRQLYAKTREAKIRGYTPGRFSFNIKGGRCEQCQGQGTKRIEMHFLPDIFVTCDACKGTRYNRETLEVRYRGKNIAEVLDLRVDEARLFFDSFAKIKQLLQSLADVGMGYITLGQASTTLSGGEAQRVKLAAELGKAAAGHTLYILDEPTTGLHFADIHHLLTVLDRLVEQNNTVLVIEHNLEVIKVADWIIDLGPEGGDEGGRLVAAGSPEDVMRVTQSHTGQFLFRYLANQNSRTTRRRARRAS